MLNQVIFTRCKPSRDFTGDGHVQTDADGYGVFTCSREAIGELSASDRAYLMDKLQKYNGSREGNLPGLIRSYDFVGLPGGGQALISICMRSAKETLGMTRKGGISIRPNAFVVQSFAGQFSGYPYRWFGSPVWTAHQASAADYYLDGVKDPQPPFLPQVQEDEGGNPGNDFSTDVQQFIEDGRREALAACVAFLLQEYDKPETERRILIIRDEPRNVERWVTAIGQAFSPRLSLIIPFSTNRSKLNGNPETVLFEAAEQGGGQTIVSGYAGVQGSTRPAYMITGIHPQDPFCANIRANRSSRFIVLDGASRRFEGELETDTGAEYFRSVEEQGVDLQDFCTVVLQAIDIPYISSQIPRIYDAYRYLLDEDHCVDAWNYPEALLHLQTLSQYGVPKHEGIVSSLLADFEKVYPVSMIQKDQANRYALLNLLSEYAGYLGRQGDITDLLADGLGHALNTITDAGSRDDGSFGEVWKGLSYMGDSVLDSVLSRVLTENVCKALGNEQTLKKCSPGTILSVSDMFCRTQSGQGEDRAMDLIRVEEFALAAVKVLKDQPETLRPVLENMEGLGLSSGSLVCRAAIEAEKEAGAGDNSGLWSALYTGKSTDTENVCMDLLQGADGSDPADMEAAGKAAESFLAYVLRQTGSCTSGMRHVFEQIQQSDCRAQDCGNIFFGTWAEISDMRSQPELIKMIRNADLPLATQKKLFHSLQKKVSLDEAVKSGDFWIRSMDDWGKTMGIRSRAGFHAHMNSELKRAVKADDVLSVLKKYAGYGVLESSLYFTSNTFDEFCRICGRLKYGDIHLAALSVFTVKDEKAQGLYLTRYVESNLQDARGRDMAEAMYGFCEAILTDALPDWGNPADMKKLQGDLEDVFRDQAKDYYKSSLIQDAARIKDTDKAVEDYLLRFLEELDEKKKKSGGAIGGFFKNLFGRKGSD